MKTLEWNSIDKSSWLDGPWQSEPDKRQWRDEATGLPCLIVRSPSGGNLCGYVGISKGHPLYEKSYSDRIPVPSRDDVKIGPNFSPIALLLESSREDDGCCAIDVLLDVHGGITFGAHCHAHPEGEGRGVCHVVEAGEDDHVWWLGFDCAHAWDVSPAYDFSRGPDSSYRDFAYVESEVTKLAQQLAEYRPPMVMAGGMLCPDSTPDDLGELAGRHTVGGKIDGQR